MKQEDRSSDEDSTSSISSEWLAMSDSDSVEQEAGAASDQRTVERCVDTGRMFKLRRALSQLDLYHQQKEEDVRTAREQQRVCREHIQELLEQRDRLEEEMDSQRAADNSAGLFRLRAQHRRLCEELQREEEQELVLKEALHKHQLELCEAEVELAKVSSLRRELHQDEQSYNLHKQQQSARRLQQERQACSNRQAKIKNKNQAKSQQTYDKGNPQKNIPEEVKKTRSSSVDRVMRESILRAQSQEVDRRRECRERAEIRRQAVKALQTNISAAHSRARAPRRREQRVQRGQPEEETRPWAGGPGSAVEKQHKPRCVSLSAHRSTKPRERQKAKGLEIEAGSSVLKEQQLLRRQTLQPAQPKAPQRSNLPSSPPLPSTPLYPTASRERFQDPSDSEDSSDPEEQFWPGQEKEEEEEEEEEEGAGADLEQPEFCGLWAHDYKEKKLLVQTEAAQNKRPTLSDKLNSSAPTSSTKETRGRSFSCKPELLHFKDFDVNQTYKRKVILTNVSYTTNTCRFSAVSAPLNGCVSVSFEPPGLLSTGMSCELHVVFEPHVNEDLEGEIRFSTASGSFSVPVRCSTKKSQMEVDSQCLDFGSHVVGQTVTRCITLINRGALGSSFRLDMSDQTSPEHSSWAPCGPTATPQEVDCGEAEVDDEKRQESGDQPETHQTETESPADPLTSDPSHSPDATPRDSSHSRNSSHPDDSSHFADSSDATCDVHFGSVTEGHVGPSQSTKLDVIFKPTIPGDTRLTFYIHFSDPSSAPIPVQVKASAVSEPLWVAHPNVDLKICVWDQSYHRSICVHSRASTALKLTFEVCPELRRHMEVLPKTGFIQAQSSFKALLKFTPRPSLPEDAGELFDRDTSVLEAPLEVHAPGQVCTAGPCCVFQCVSVTVSAVLTSSDLSLDLSLLDFGPCSVHQAGRSRVHLSNLSLLPQDFGFCNVPEFLEVQPDHGFGTLLPQETLPIDLIFRPKKVQSYNFQLSCKTGLNRDLLLSCRGLGVRPPLEFSHTAVQFGATALGHCSSALVYITNTERPLTPAEPRLFSFHVPDQSDVSVSPSTGSLLPGERCVVQLSFRPTLHETELREESDTRTEAQKECPAEGSRGQTMQKTSARPTLTPPLGHLTVTCCVSDPVSKSSPDQTPSWSPVNVLYLQLHCPVTQPPLVVTSDTGGNSVDFQNVAVGETVVQKCVVQNVTEETQHLGSSLLAPGGPFSVLNALRPLRPGQKRLLLLAFSPSRALKYRERVELRCLRGALWLRLRGEGVEPAVTCSSSAPELDFGHVLVRESSCHTLKLQNHSTVDVGFRTFLSSRAPPALQTETSRGQSVQLLSGGVRDVSAFSVVPAEGRLAPGQSQDVRLCFHPREEQEFRDHFTVQLFNQSAVCEMNLRGAACSHSVFVCGGDPLNLPPTLTPGPGSQTSEDEPTPVLVTLRAPGSSGQRVPAVRQLQVGCVRSTPPSKKSAEFVWELSGSVQQQGFNVDPTRGALEPGTARTVTVTWTPPGGHKPHHVLQSCVSLTVKADAVRVYSVTLLALVTPADPADP
ncbi:cilia- and flagella-associated protein 74 [Boleophthalmus pectinirostris]|uniref:cilia- and flagella-associated protein 74 n=1 Tax=Boleophthalmus pectinirostris TaxID=150288 RepID=UPI00242D91D1|nr:cilia- and flagella-associated protein 74 [Boleophthalmus pectinirostris]